MPNMNGYEFVNHIKKINPKVKVILMSYSEIDEEEFSNLLPNVKIDAFIQKPFSLDTVRNIVKKNGSTNSQCV
jgi:response regulator RpfG family c-di-GMP phosphodiesterase